MCDKCVTIQMKTTKQYFHVVLFTTLCKVVLTFKYKRQCVSNNNDFSMVSITSSSGESPLLIGGT